ncbi:MAG: PilZ domain-containing protein [Treponema sp.]|nr:PilZ domain-containing protein [Treponema sp.]
MCAKARKDARYDVLGRVECSLSPLPGTLLDISLNGCKLHFSTPVTIEPEQEYTLKVKFTDTTLDGVITLIGTPMWCCEDSGTTDIGMKILHSPDTDKYIEYIKALHLESISFNSIEDQIKKQECQFL